MVILNKVKNILKDQYGLKLSPLAMDELNEFMLTQVIPLIAENAKGAKRKTVLAKDANTLRLKDG